MQKSKTGILFVVYQQIELDTFLPVAIELQSKKNYDIKFFFTDEENLEVIKKNTTFRNLTKKFGFSFKANNKSNYLIKHFLYTLEKTKIFFWLMTKKKTAIFFPTYRWVNNSKTLNFIFKFFKSKKFFLFKSRAVDDENIVVKKLIRKYNFDKKDLNFFDYFIYYHDLQTDIIKELRKKLEKNNINKIVKIGLPRLFPSWKKEIKIESKNELKKIKSKYGNFTNIYSIIGVTLRDLQISKISKNQLLKCIENLIEIIKKIDPKAIILYLPHPRDKNSNFFLEKFKNKNYRFDNIYIHADILSNISKRIFFIKPNNILTNTLKSFKINYAISPKEKKINFYGKGYGTFKLEPKKLTTKKLIKLFDDKFYLKKENSIFNKENELISNNSPNIEKLIKLIV